MTNKEASKNCERIKTYLSAGNPMWDASVIVETLDMAIKALEQPEPCEDDCRTCDMYDKERHYCPKWCSVIKYVLKDAKEDAYAHGVAEAEARFHAEPCEDAVSRLEAIEALISHITPHDNGDGTTTIGILSKSSITDILNDLPSAKPEPHWIPVTERLPKSNGVYIVTRTIEDGFTSADIVDACYFDGSNTWHDDTRVNHGRKYLNDIKAWMPLPAPYREEE